MKRIEVEWIDSASEQGWRSHDDATRTASTDDMACLTCGYLADENPTYLLVALNRQEQRGEAKAMVGDTIQIPKLAIKTITELAPKRQTKRKVPPRRTTRRRTR